MPKIASKHHIRLLANSVETPFCVAQDGGQLAFNVDTAPGLMQSARPGTAQYSDYPPEQQYTEALVDFSWGLGQLEEDPLRPETKYRYHYSSGLDTRWPGKVMQGPDIQDSGVDPEFLGLDDTFDGIAVWQDEIFIGSGRAIYKWELDTGVWCWKLWFDSGAHATDHQAIRSMVVHNDKLIVQFAIDLVSSTDERFWIFTDPDASGTNTQNNVFKHANANTEIYHMVSLRDTLYMASNTQKVWASTDETDTTFANWTEHKVGDLTTSIRAMWGARDVVWCGKDDGLHAIDSTSSGGSSPHVVDLSNRPSSKNFKFHTVWGDEIWASLGRDGSSMLVYNMVTRSYRTEGYHPRDIAPDSPQVGGAIQGLAASDKALYIVATREGSDGPAYSLIEVRRRIWQGIPRLTYNAFAGNANKPNMVYP